MGLFDKFLDKALSTMNTINDVLDKKILLDNTEGNKVISNGEITDKKHNANTEETLRDNNTSKTGNILPSDINCRVNMDEHDIEHIVIEELEPLNKESYAILHDAFDSAVYINFDNYNGIFIKYHPIFTPGHLEDIGFSEGGYKSFITKIYNSILDFSKNVSDLSIKEAMSDNISDILFKYYLVRDDVFKKKEYQNVIKVFRNNAYNNCMRMAGFNTKVSDSNRITIEGFEDGNCENRVLFLTDFLDKISYIASIFGGPEYDNSEYDIDSMLAFITGYNVSGFYQFIDDCRAFFLKHGSKEDGSDFFVELSSGVKINKELYDTVDEIQSIDMAHGKFLSEVTTNCGIVSEIFEDSLVREYASRSANAIQGFDVYCNFLKCYKLSGEILDHLNFVDMIIKKRDALRKFVSKAERVNFDCTDFRATLTKEFGLDKYNPMDAMRKIKNNKDLRRYLVLGFLSNPEKVYLMTEELIPKRDYKIGMEEGVCLPSGLRILSCGYLYVIAMYYLILLDFGFDLLNVDLRQFLYGSEDTRLREFNNAVIDKELVKKAFDVNFGAYFEIMGIPKNMYQFVLLYTFDMSRYNTIDDIKKFRDAYNNVDTVWYSSDKNGTHYDKVRALRMYNKFVLWLFGDKFTKKNIRVLKKQNKIYIKVIRKLCMRLGLYIAMDTDARSYNNNVIYCKSIVGDTISYDSKKNDIVFENVYNMIYTDLDNPYLYNYAMKLFYGMKYWSSDLSEKFDLTRLSACSNGYVTLQQKSMNYDTNVSEKDSSVSVLKNVITSLSDKYNSLLDVSIKSNLFGVVYHDEGMNKRIILPDLIVYFAMLDCESLEKFTDFLDNCKYYGNGTDIRKMAKEYTATNRNSNVRIEYNGNNRHYELEDLPYDIKIRQWYKFYIAIQKLFDFEYSLLQKLDELRKEDFRTLKARRIVASSVGFIDLLTVINKVDDTDIAFPCPIFTGAFDDVLVCGICSRYLRDISKLFSIIFADDSVACVPKDDSVLEQISDIKANTNNKKLLSKLSEIETMLKDRKSD